MTTERLVSAAACGDRYDKPLSGVLHHDQGHDLFNTEHGSRFTSPRVVDVLRTPACRSP